MADIYITNPHHGAVSWVNVGLMLRTFIDKVLGSNMGKETDFPDPVFS
jgi:hypothetical protein